MNFRQYIEEEYLETIQITNPKLADVVVFVNPTSSDFKDPTLKQKNVRFIAHTDTNTLYVWNANAGFHFEVATRVKIKYTTKSFWGYGVIKQNKIRIEYLDHGNKFKYDDLPAFQKYFVNDLRRAVIDAHDNGGYIYEEYYELLKDYSGGELPVFVNPDKKELRECGRHIRFIIDLDKDKMYTWNAYKAIHGVVIGKLKLQLHAHIRGEAILKNDKMWFDQGEAYYTTKDAIRNKSWINKYLDLEYLLNNVDFPHS